jgi:sugar phosphate permease
MEEGTGSGRCGGTRVDDVASPGSFRPASPFPVLDMIELWRFFRRRRPLLLYGVGLAAVSSFGQTFFISLFVPSFLEAFPLTPASFGVLYAVATLTGALLLPVTARWIDRIPLSGYTGAVLGTLALSALLVAGSQTAWMLGLGLLGLRLAGQGLSSHASLTVMARYFSKERGKALSIANLGFPMGEAVLPLALAGFLAVAGWRLGWVVVAAVILGVVTPLALRLLRSTAVELDPRRLNMDGGTGRDAGMREAEVGQVPLGRSPTERDPAEEDQGRAVPRERRPVPSPRTPGEWSASRVLRDPRFWLLVPAALLPPFWATGLILYQTSLASAKGWSLPMLASAFVGFALARIIASLAIGGAIDRVSARRLFPAAVLPMGLGVALLAVADRPWVAFAYLALLGTTVGLSGTLKTALWAELYGIRHLGAIKSMEGTLMVVSTAAAPLLVGWALEDPGRLLPLLWTCVGSVVGGFLIAGLGLADGWGPPPGARGPPLSTP